jgi:hypothetical protein
MNLLFIINQSVCRTKAIWSFADLGQSCFGTAGDDGNIIVWKVSSPLLDK